MGWVKRFEDGAFKLRKDPRGWKRKAEAVCRIPVFECPTTGAQVWRIENFFAGLNGVVWVCVSEPGQPPSDPFTVRPFLERNTFAEAHRLCIGGHDPLTGHGYGVFLAWLGSIGVLSREVTEETLGEHGFRQTSLIIRDQWASGSQSAQIQLRKIVYVPVEDGRSLVGGDHDNELRALLGELPVPLLPWHELVPYVTDLPWAG